MRAISRTHSKSASGCFFRLVGLAFVLVGSVIFVALSGKALLNWYSAQSWAAVYCTILSSDVVTHDASDGDTYSIDIRYAYEWDGQRYESNQYNFFGGSSSGRGRKEAVVAQYPAGESRECYVNPELPSEAVLDRSFTPVYLIGCFGLIFVLIGGAMVLHRSKKRGSIALTTGSVTATLVRPLDPADLNNADEDALSSGAVYARSEGVNPGQIPLHGPVALKGGNNSLIGFVFMLVFAAIWNSIISVAVWDTVGFGDNGSFDLVMGLFLIPFVLIGLALLGGTGYFFLTLFNPRVDLTMDPGRLHLGGSAVVGWAFRGNSTRISKLTITLQGQEAATYRRGTSTTTDHSVFEKTLLFQTEDPVEIQSGQAHVTIPEFTAPTFNGANNKVQWQIKVNGDIARWPDVNEEFEVIVLPLPLDESTLAHPAEFRPSGASS